MKKKIWILLIVMILATVCAVALSACDFIFDTGDKDKDKDKDKDNNNGQDIYPINVYFVADSPRYDSEQKCFVFYYGEKVEFSNDEFVATMYYNDDSSKVVEDFTIENPFDNPKYTYKLGEHKITLRYAEGNFERSQIFKVKLCPVQNYVVDVPEVFETEYTGEYINILQIANKQLEKDGKPTLTEREEAGEIICRPKYHEVTHVGTYEILILPTEYYIFDSFSVWVKVTPKIIAVPTLAENEVVYDGSWQPPKFEYEEGTELLIKIRCLTYENYTVVNTYDHVARVKDDDYAFGIDEYGESIMEATITYKILPKVLDYNKEDLQLSRTEYPYRSRGYFIEDIEHGFDSAVFDVSLSKVWVESGTYSVRLHCPLPECFRYKNGDKPDEDLSFEITVYKLTYDYSDRLDEIADTLLFSETYRDNLMLSDVIGDYLEDDDFLVKVQKAVDSPEESYYRQTLELAEDVALEAGRHVCNIRYTPYENGYNYTLLPITVEVAKREISLEYSWSGDMYNVMYNGTTHSCRLEITGQNKDKLTEVEYVTKIRNGEDNYEPVEEAVNAGSYVTVAAVALQPQYEKNYRFVEPAESATTIYWDIKPATIALKRSQYSWSDITHDMFEPADGYDTSNLFTLVDDIAPLEMTDFAVYYMPKSSFMGNGSRTNVIKTPGYYTAIAYFRSTDPNYKPAGSGEIRTSWDVYDTVIDLSDVKWTDAKTTVTYGEEIVLPELTGVPDKVDVRYIGCKGGLLDAGDYYYSTEFALNSRFAEYKNSERVTITHKPYGVWFKVEPIRITENDFKVVYYREVGLMQSTSDYDAGNPPKFYNIGEEYLFYVECNGLPLEFNYSYKLLSYNMPASNIDVTDAGIKCSANGYFWFTATITASGDTKNYYISGAQLVFTKQVFILKG